MLLYLELLIGALLIAVLRTSNLHEAQSAAGVALGLLFVLLLGTYLKSSNNNSPRKAS